MASPSASTTRAAAGTVSTSSPTIRRSRTRASARADECCNACDDLANRHLLCLARSAGLQLHASLLEGARPDRHARRNADQVRVLELDARALVAIVEDRV